jgi:hypothetical protein
MFLDVKGFQDLGPTEDIFLVILQFHLVEREIARILGMATDVKCKGDGLEVAHLHKIRGKTHHEVVFVLTAIVVHVNGQLIARVALPQPLLIKKIVHDEGCKIVASLLRGELMIGIAIQLVGQQAQVTNVTNLEQVDCERRKLIDFLRLFASVARHVHVMRIVADNGVLAPTFWHLLGVTLSGSQRSHLSLVAVLEKRRFSVRGPKKTVVLRTSCGCL